MHKLKSLWKVTKAEFDGRERELVDRYISFLREVAVFYLKQNRRVFFQENNVVHWGEGNFGWLIIEGKEEVNEVFGEYISEIQFKPKINKEIIKGYTEIKEKNLEDIRYGI